MAQSTFESKLIRLAFQLFVFLWLSACVTTPSQIYQSKADKLGLSESLIATEIFDLTVFSNNKNNNTEVLHIYLEGDGQPFLHNRYINLDPTSTKGLALDLMAQDPNASLLVGRPCYHTSIKQQDRVRGRGCDDNKWWTSHRYNSIVVDSIAQAISQLNQNQSQIVLIGYSGGGALAMLLANKVQNIRSIVTISANLDIHAWTQYHAYTPLFGSLNPIETIGQTKEIKQLHLVGDKDKNIPHALWHSQISKPKLSTVKRYPEFNHSCCWQKIWPDVLSELM